MKEKRGQRNIFWHQATVSRQDRESLSGHSGVALWLTGLSAAGKSTIAVTLENMLYERGLRTYILDGDNIRHGLNSNLGFSPEDRTENIRRVGEVAKLFTESAIITLTAFISPYRKDRDMVRRMFGRGDFIEVFVDCPLKVCEERDPKGIYKKARTGEIPSFTGITAPYETPINPEIRIDTSILSIEESAAILLAYLDENGFTSRAIPTAGASM